MPFNSALPPDLEDALADAPPDERAALAHVWTLLGDAAPAPVGTATDDAWASLRSRVATPRLAADRSPARPFRRRRSAAVGAGVAALVALAAVWTLAPVTHRAAPGETAAVLLPDGSSVTLAVGAEITHSRLFRSRDVALVGEAFFDVESGTPFTVATHNARVEVLGTAFNVRAWEGETAVALVHGRVRVTSPTASADSEVAELTPGQALVVADGALAPTDIDVEREAAWREGAFSIQDRPLGAVLHEVERRYDVAIRTAPGAPLDARVSAFYDQLPNLGALLGDLGAAADVRFEPVADGYRVRAVTPPAPAPPAPTTSAAP